MSISARALDRGVGRGLIPGKGLTVRREPAVKLLQIQPSEYTFGVFEIMFREPLCLLIPDLPLSALSVARY